MYDADMQPVLVTRSTGNVGRLVVDYLVAAGVPVRRPPSAPRAATGPTGPCGNHRSGGGRALDFGDPGTWQAASEGVRVMFLVRPPAISRVKRDLLPAVAAAQGTASSTWCPCRCRAPSATR